MAIVAILIRLKLGSPVIFRQNRVGLSEKIFTVYKFRTMTNDRDAEGNLLSNSKRISPLGRILRKTSLDELPQLWNVVNGSMSLVGPRPLLIEYVPCYTERESRRHSVRPGITGLAQVSGRNTLLWDDRLELDVNYVENQSFWLDMHILTRTVLKVILRKDIIDVPETAQGPLTMYRQGNKAYSNELA